MYVCYDPTNVGAAIDMKIRLFHRVSLVESTSASRVGATTELSDFSLPCMFVSGSCGCHDFFFFQSVRSEIQCYNFLPGCYLVTEGSAARIFIPVHISTRINILSGVVMTSSAIPAIYGVFIGTQSESCLPMQLDPERCVSHSTYVNRSIRCCNQYN